MPDADRYELFSYWRTSATYRVRVAFNLKGVRPRETNVDIDAGEQHGEAFRRINPLGGIPALVDHGAGQPALPMTQSLALLEFIDETYPELGVPKIVFERLNPEGEPFDGGADPANKTGAIRGVPIPGKTFTPPDLR